MVVVEATKLWNDLLHDNKLLHNKSLVHWIWRQKFESSVAYYLNYPANSLIQRAPASFFVKYEYSILLIFHHRW